MTAAATSTTAARNGRFVDLHMHSTASDGALSPTAVVDAAVKIGLTAIALTDHDTVAGVAEAKETGHRLGLRVVAGVELSAFEGDAEAHVLGLHVSGLEKLEAELRRFRDTRRSRAERIVAILNSLGVPLHMDQVIEQAGDGAIGRPHVARALVAGGWVKDVKEAFDLYIGSGRPGNVDKHRITTEDAIRIVHEAGGLAILAHPGEDGSLARIETLARSGLDGAEVRHPAHSNEDATRLLALVDHFKLVPSGGSDFHGAPSGPRSLGSMRIPAEWLDRQDARLAERAKQSKGATTA
ncbi:MAG: PHP domain-containing protein [Gemmatimonadaceae bacterium]